MLLHTSTLLRFIGKYCTFYSNRFIAQLYSLVTCQTNILNANDVVGL